MMTETTAIVVLTMATAIATLDIGYD